MFNKKGLTIPTLGTIFVIITIAFFAFVGVLSTSFEAGNIQKGGLAISLSNHAEFFRKSLDESIQIVAKRSAYEIGETGGFSEPGTAVWRSDYPTLNDLRDNLESRIMENLPKYKIEGTRTIEWGYGKIKIRASELESKGDLNLNGIVDSSDNDTFIAAFGSSPDDSNWNKYADLNDDNEIDVFDLMKFNYGITGPPLSEEKNFILKLNKNFSIYDKVIDSTIYINHFFNGPINSTYFRLAYIGRQMFEDPRYSVNLNSIGLAQLKTDLENDFTISATLTADENFIDILLEDRNCDLINNFYCIAPLRDDEDKVFLGGKLRPFDYIKLHFRVVA